MEPSDELSDLDDLDRRLDRTLERSLAPLDELDLRRPRVGGGTDLLTPRYWRRLGLGLGGWALTAGAGALALGGVPWWGMALTVLPVFPVTLLVDALARWSPEEGVLAWLDDKLDDLWEGNGGGFYAAMTVTTFLRLEWNSLAGDLSSVLSALGSLDIGGLIGFFIGQLIEGILNTIWSALWWVTWLSSMTMVEMAIFGVIAYTLYALARWLAGPQSLLD